MPEGHATVEGTARYAGRLQGVAPDHFRDAFGLRLSSIGLGTYLGESDDAEDALYEEAVTAALGRGANVLDTAINYRCQRSERAVGRALARAIAERGISRDEVVVATKGGYLPFDGSPPASREAASVYFQRTFVEAGVLDPRDLVGGVHCMSPSWLRDQIRRSLENLGLRTIDIYYLHNPEQQLAEVSKRDFLRRVRAAFETLEEAASEGRIRFYGTATWNGFRGDPDGEGYLSLGELVELARDVGGTDHRFRFVQLPYNLAMHEALTLANQRLRVDGDEGWAPLLQAAPRLGIAVMGSASLLQGRLARGLPEALEKAFPGLGSDACRALQFSRSTPGLTTALVGMKREQHVAENLALAATPPADEEALLKIFQPA